MDLLWQARQHNETPDFEMKPFVQSLKQYITRRVPNEISITRLNIEDYSNNFRSRQPEAHLLVSNHLVRYDNISNVGMC